jgi:uncharacterized RDD family membrane protein YckC
MNIEPTKQPKPTKTPPTTPIEDMDFDFKPITSGLGFHHQTSTEVRGVITERTVAVSPIQPALPPKKEMPVYQSDLSMFYGRDAAPEVSLPELTAPAPEEKVYRLASPVQRFFAYLLDLFLVVGALVAVVTVMARTISMDLMEAWRQYPNEITPLVVTLFCGFYLMYFSIFEKASQSTIGKNAFGLRVTGVDNRSLSLLTLLLRSAVSLLNFASLGLFSYFDLQNKVTGAKVIRVS